MEFILDKIERRKHQNKNKFKLLSIVFHLSSFLPVSLMIRKSRRNSREETRNYLTTIKPVERFEIVFTLEPSLFKHLPMKRMKWSDLEIDRRLVETFGRKKWWVIFTNRKLEHFKRKLWISERKYLLYELTVTWFTRYFSRKIKVLDYITMSVLETSVGYFGRNANFHEK